MVTAPSLGSLPPQAMMMSATTDQAAPAANGVTTTVIADGDDGGGYLMLESSELSEDGGFLGGNIFFEVAEEFTLQLSRSGADSMRVRVRVVEIERGDEPGMWVEFVDVGDVERKKLGELIASK